MGIFTAIGNYLDAVEFILKQKVAGFILLRLNLEHKWAGNTFEVGCEYADHVRWLKRNGGNEPIERFIMAALGIR